jgi:hypothetical protein
LPLPCLCLAPVLPPPCLCLASALPPPCLRLASTLLPPKFLCLASALLLVYALPSSRLCLASESEYSLLGEMDRISFGVHYCLELRLTILFPLCHGSALPLPCFYFASAFPCLYISAVSLPLPLFCLDLNSALNLRSHFLALFWSSSKPAALFWFA